MKSHYILIIILSTILNVNAQLCLSPATIYPVGINASSICHGYFNGDSIIDLAVANKSGSVSILLGDGAGGFGIAQDYHVGFLSNSICTADFNGDSIADIATSNLGPWNASIIFGDGTGGFGTDSGTGQISNPSAIVSADFNGDSKPDLAVSSQFNVSILLGDGAGNFSSPVSYGTGVNYTSIISTYFSGDTIVDLALGGSQGFITVMKGNGTGGFITINHYSTGLGTTPISISSSDFNEDNIPDLVSANNFANNVSVLLGDSSGNFSLPVNFPAGTNPQSIISADFDGDGHVDLTMANANSGNISLLTGDGAGSFSQPLNFAVDSFPVSLTNGDFNGDGKMDLAVVSTYSNIDTGKVEILLNCGTTGISNPEAENKKIILFPNPSNGIFTIEVNKLTEPITDVKVFNVYGQKIFSTSKFQSTPINSINLKDESPGIYFAEIFQGGKYFIKKIVVQ